jgi:hypothetical protein
MSTLSVRYVGLKPKETDCVAGTGLTWIGKGDVQQVPVKAWDIMQKHPDVWELVDTSEDEPTGLALAAASVNVDTQAQADLSAMDAPSLREWAAANGKQIDGRLKSADAIRKHLLTV